MSQGTMQCGLRPGDRLPAVVLRSAPGGRSVRLREPAAGSPVVLSLPAEIGPWTEYARDFAQPRPGYRNWAARPLLLVTGDLEDARRVAVAVGIPTGLPAPGRVTRHDTVVLADPGGAVREGWDVPEDAAVVVVADRWGEVYAVTCGRTPDELPGPAEIDEWVRFLSMQCPECGVIDEPGHGEWQVR